MEKKEKIVRNWEERRAERARKITSHIKESLSEMVIKNRGYR